MSKYAVMPLDDYTNVCETIREKTATTENIKSGDLPEKVNAVYKAGQKAEYDKFWDVYQDYGNRTNYANAFYNIGWNDETYQPKYNIVIVGNGYGCFGYSNITDTKVDIDISNSTNAGNFFYTCFYLKTIKKLIVSEKITSYTNFFKFCVALEDIAIEGIIGADISFADSNKLTHDSLMSIINALKDFSGTTTTKTLTLHADSKALLTDSEKAIATQKGWTIA